MLNPNSRFGDGCMTYLICSGNHKILEPRVYYDKLLDFAKKIKGVPICYTLQIIIKPTYVKERFQIVIYYNYI